jgi:hypothetical protein
VSDPENAYDQPTPEYRPTSFRTQANALSRHTAQSTSLFCYLSWSAVCARRSMWFSCRPSMRTLLPRPRCFLRSDARF